MGCGWSLIWSVAAAIAIANAVTAVTTAAAAAAAVVVVAASGRCYSALGEWSILMLMLLLFLPTAVALLPSSAVTVTATWCCPQHIRYL